MTVTDHAGPGTGEELPEEVVEELLEDRDCRRVLSCLADVEGPVAVKDLARAVAASESGVAESAVDEETVSSYRDALFQRQLPKLTPTGVVAYNSLLGTVALDTTDERILSALK
jgi:hypothetical protein